MPFSNSCLRCRLVRWYFYNEAVARPAHVLARLPHLLPSYHPPPPLLSLSLSTLNPISATLENLFLSLTTCAQVTNTQATQSWVFHLHDQTLWICPSPKSVWIMKILARQDKAKRCIVWFVSTKFTFIVSCDESLKWSFTSNDQYWLWMSTQNWLVTIHNLYCAVQ